MTKNFRKAFLSTIRSVQMGAIQCTQASVTDILNVLKIILKQLNNILK